MKKTTKQNNLIKESAIMNRVIDFIKYHNAFTIGLILVFVFSGAIFASEDLHDAIIGEEIITQTGIDNTQLLAADLDTFDLAMTINAVSKDEENYYIDYSFNTLGIKDNVWQPLAKSATMTVSKAALGDKDLGLYLTEELGEIADYELAYLKEVQTAEIEKGKTEIVETTEYTGLVSLVLDIKNKVLPGYELVVEQAVDEFVQIAQVSQPSDINDELLMMDYQSPEPEPEPELEATPVEPAPEIAFVPEPEPEPVCDLENLNLCTNDSECTAAGGYWYNNVCNSEPLFESEPEPVIPPDIPPTDTTTPPEDGVEPGPVCDSENLDLCVDESECTEAGGYWYDSVCNIEPEPEPEPPEEPTEEPTE